MDGRRWIAKARRWRKGFAGALIGLGLAGTAGAADPVGGEALVTVMGVVAPFATFGLTKHLMGIPGVRQVRFDLLHGVADVTLQPGAVVTDKQIREAVRSASYTPGEIRWKTPPQGSPKKP
jgi:copper chaperone CopZ